MTAATTEVRNVERRAGLAAAVVLLVVCVWPGPFGMAHRDSPSISPTDVALRLDPNRATEAELMLLPRIGPKLAANIIAYRQSAATPAFRTAADLDRVPRIGPATTALLRPYWHLPPPETDDPRGQETP